MVTLEAKFKVVTPMFLSGADTTRFEWRPASFKGVLRFWWRALAWERHKGNLEAIQAQENRLFGSTDEGQASFLLHLLPGSGEKTLGVGQILKGHNGRVAGDGALYLGYGVVHPFASKKKGQEKGGAIRACLLPPASFKARLLFREKPDESIIEALKLVGLLGSMGSRSRRGFGSIACEKITRTIDRGDPEIFWTGPENRDEFQKTIHSLVGGCGKEHPAYTAFSSESRVTIVNSGETSLDLLNDIGRKMQKYRGWGKDNKIGSERAEQNFPGDHDLAYAVARGENPRRHPDRTAFGLPHNYFLSGIGKPVPVGPAKNNRRASPLLIHIHQFGNGEYAGIVTILPAVFLPQDDQIKVGRTPVPQNVDFQVLHGFLDGFEGPAGNKSGTPYFPHKTDLLSSYKASR